VKGEDITFYGLAYVLYRIFLGFSLTDATGQAGAFSNPITVLTGIKNHPSHEKYLAEILARYSHV
jgi:hypothetical protein